MKILTITCHDVYNYGASLQAFALQTFLDEQGHDVQIIDYKPEYLCRSYKFWIVPKNSRFYKWTLKSKLFHLIFCLYIAPKRYATYGRVARFKKFKQEFLKCTKQYKTYEELKNDAPYADLYICGSDQIWNTVLPNGLDPAFYCNFGNPLATRIAYAASFGVPQIQQEFVETVKNNLSSLDAISVRETTGERILESLGFSGVSVADPVFLLSKEVWERRFNLTKRPTAHPYILVYDLDNNVPELQQSAMELARDKGWKIVSICGLEVGGKYADIILKDAGPEEFLSFIKNADFVISTSFHATAFSVIFNRPFACFYKKSNISRMKDFLEIAGLSENLNPKTLTTSYSWNDVNMHIQKFVFSSKTFISEHLR